jgi:hypothetical protein
VKEELQDCLMWAAAAREVGDDAAALKLLSAAIEIIYGGTVDIGAIAATVEVRGGKRGRPRKDDTPLLELMYRREHETGEKRSKTLARWALKTNGSKFPEGEVKRLADKFTRGGY